MIVSDGPVLVQERSCLGCTVLPLASKDAHLELSPEQREAFLPVFLLGKLESFSLVVSYFKNVQINTQG